MAISGLLLLLLLFIFNPVFGMLFVMLGLFGFGAFGWM